MWLLLLMLTSLVMVGAYRCPDNFVITLDQTDLVSRPEGEVWLTCAITGLPASDVEYYRWIREEQNTPLFTYSEKYQIDGMGRGAIGLVLDEIHSKGSKRMETRLKLHVNLTDYNSYKCEFKVPSENICRKMIRIRFVEPTINITHHEYQQSIRDGFRTTTYKITCSINAAAGEPKFALGFENQNNGTIWITETHTELSMHHHHYFGTASGEVTLSGNGMIFCNVTDRRGNYTSNRTVTATENIALNQGSQSDNTTSKVIPIVVAALIALVLAGVAAAIWVVRSKRTRKRGRSETEKLLLTEFSAKKGRGDYLSDHWAWRHIKDISTKPRLFNPDGPSMFDIIQTHDVQAHSWFLSALHWLCQGEHVNHITYMFEDAMKIDLLKESSIPIKLWFCGEWKTVGVEPTLPTRDGKLCFLKSSDDDVFWSALLQKAFLEAYIPYIGLEHEMVIHALEGLTGNILYGELVTEYKYQPNLLIADIIEEVDGGTPPLCVSRDDERFIFYNIIGAKQEEAPNVSLIQLNEFTEKYDSNFPNSTFSDEVKRGKLDQGPHRNEFWITHSAFFQEIERVYWYVTGSGNPLQIYGKWDHIADRFDFHKDEFWNYPQYLLRYDLEHSTADGEVTVNLALMQRQPQMQDRFAIPLSLGFKCFKITDDVFEPKLALTGMRHDITHSGFSEKSEKTRERLVGWNLNPGVKIIVIPCASGPYDSGEFLLRVYSQENHAISLKELPPRRDG